MRLVGDRVTLIAAILLLGAASGCAVSSAPAVVRSDSPYVVVLGIAQDGGYPHAGCERACCLEAWSDPARRRSISSIAIVDPASGERWLIDLTPDFTAQLHLLNTIHPIATTPLPRDSPIAGNLGLTGVLLTHAHIGHYTGLMMLGREAIGARAVPAWAMPAMRTFLESSEPWAQLVRLSNIEIRPLEADREVQLNERLRVTPIRVPHRDEISETVGFLIAGPARKALFIPDIDKWERWDRRIEDLLAGVDRAWLDGTFYADGEVPGRSMSEIPHPFISETMERLRALPATERAKVRFIHLNHTNPALDPSSPESREIERQGFGVAAEGERFPL